jgi:hypothetical protein
MPYTTVFEITQKSFEWWFPAVGLAGVPIGTLLLLIAKAWPSQKRAKFTGYLLIAFGLIWTGSVFASTYSQYRKCVNAYRSGRF